MTLKEADPKGLIRESYRIEGITAGECRSIFLDWAINMKPSDDPAAHIHVVLDHYGAAAPDHPMSQVLRDGLRPKPAAKRRGGRAARLSRDS
ncbi:hypothetical protein [Algirhabdus cladophorae]|uniref:hypothetical protein n=1 Tax=Algirhabdus cladophorae TaxID=3377108 RepID=UPI003B845F5A